MIIPISAKFKVYTPFTYVSKNISRYFLHIACFLGFFLHFCSFSVLFCPFWKIAPFPSSPIIYPFKCKIRHLLERVSSKRSTLSFLELTVAVVHWKETINSNVKVEKKYYLISTPKLKLSQLPL